MVRARFSVLDVTAAAAMAMAAACAYDPAGIGQPGGGGRDDVGPPLPPMAVKIAPGDFMMGCNPAVVKPCDSDELPYHAVELGAYEIDRFEVQQDAYQACIRAGACTPPLIDRFWDPVELASYPVIGVSWYQASAYCTWTGRRLPTEAEWERAARGDDGRIWPWGDQAPDCERANFMGCGMAPRPAGLLVRGASPAGAFDMAGNAVEWVADWYDPDAYLAHTGGDAGGEGGGQVAVNPSGPATGAAKVLRGGGYESDPRSVRASYRGAYAPGAPLETVGFRCARTVEESPPVD